MMASSTGCCLCGQIRGDAANDLIAQMLPAYPYVRRILCEGRSFAVIPSLGPLRTGHSLLCPKSHVRSFAQLGPADEAEYLAMKGRLRAALGLAHGPKVVLFEHGMAMASDRILCTVSHAHMHFVPVPETFDLGDACKLGWEVFDGSLAALRELAGNREYSLYESPEGESRILTAAEGVLESQYMRRVIARSLGNATHWNWRESPAPLAVHEFWSAFRLHSMETKDEPALLRHHAVR
jgi:ATP adenylyltransferase